LKIRFIMHELSISQSIIRVIEKSLPAGFSKKVIEVNLSIGKLSGIEIDSLVYSFSLIKNKSVLKEAEIFVKEITGLAQCNECNCQFEINKYGIPCPSCKSYSLKILKGKEMNIISVKVED
jgi:hydrogenase nickel incorporation protein HypA/HybF